MRILIALNHPSQYYLFKNFELEISKNGYSVLFVINDKDILKILLERDNKNFIQLSTKKSNKGLISIVANRGLELILQDIKMYQLVNRWKPNILMGTDISIAHIGKIKKIPSVIFNEDDFNINKLFCKAAYPFSNFIFSPLVCDVGKYENKKIGYNGYQKLAYLHPNRFRPDIKIVEKYINIDRPYFIIRLVSFTAGHDIERQHGGITTNLLQKLIDKLNPYGHIYITSEKPLINIFEKYRLEINPLHIHHILAYAHLFIGDSQSMCVESSVLGTASIRFNSFVGKISVLEELEKKYNLTYGINNLEETDLLKKLDELLSIKDLKLIYKTRQKEMLQDKIDLTGFMIWFVENYPESVRIMKENPDYQYNFK
ncbi:MAG: hypothetical protein A2X13_11655 [Bacteroidetes bacterium GWC2_33_15]|nr:MAG: hypothetical protein A2X10_05680 [Bacteroidetes bacterium GWA2_33_15]OFX50793.1 MAG: hypothetical protein A2X13_11655 [Bacteroidetes bacterium GWC2_33_15]OFX62924.1 MAG: hypothetical protein A2X15_09715 [Bacteroidetes bacterium GWB2_32_14]OFX69994.1 MAG: hypothetical protein A2X14_02575 [Bacteroidetes bacterium GWD2_33_33]HAN18990.1 hypothetical protein [Bacteroidales bacterium]